MNRIKLAALLTASAAILTACAGWHGSGTVVKKDYDKPYTSYSSCSSSSKNCHSTSTYHSAEWKLRVRDAEGDEHWVEVPEREYSETKIGDTFSNGVDE